MNIETLRDFALSLPGSEESCPFGPETLVFKVEQKIFLLVSLDREALQFNVKCQPDRALEWREQYPDEVLPGYHMNKKHWNTIIVDGRLSGRQVKEMIDDSYGLVAPKKKK